MPDDAERRGLGTPATRASIIENLISNGYVERKKKNILPTEKGVYLISVLPEGVKSPQMTADWEWALKDIERGALNPEKFMQDMTVALNQIIADYPPSSIAEASKGQFGGSGYSTAGESLGSCPRCGNGVFEKAKGFFCSSENCKFGLFKDNSLFSKQKKKLTKTIVAKLVNDGKAHVEGFVSVKTGKPYNATVVMDASGDGWPQFKMEF